MPSYTPIDIENALREVRSGLSQRLAATRYGIPRTTLRYRYEGGENAQTSQAYRQRLSTLQEDHLRDWVLTHQALGLPPSHADLRHFATEILKAQGDEQELGKRWVAGFLRRNSEIKTLRGKGIDFARFKGANPYRSEISRISNLSDTAPVGKAIFLAAYKKARDKGLTIRNITAGWKATGLWPINVNKPLQSRLVAQSLDATTTTATGSPTASTNAQKEPKELFQTPRHSGQLSKLSQTFLSPSADLTARRLFIRKIGRRLDGQNTTLANAEARIKSLEQQNDDLRRRKRAKVTCSPN